MTEDQIDIVVAVEGERNPRTLPGRNGITVTELIEIAVRETGRGDLVEVIVEDEEIALDGAIRFHEVITTEFKLFHVASKDHIKVVVEYGQKAVSRNFRPSATMDKIIRWAITPQELDVQSPPEDLQLKKGKEVLPGDVHLGQISEGHKEVKLSLVFKIKPQG
jgi:hypothetical protein